MKIAVLTAMLAGFFAAIGGLHANEPTPAAGIGTKASCILSCQREETHCRQYCTADECPCADQFDACMARCDALPN
jgi:hypothetical protein